MTNEELKKKIVEIIINAIWKDAEADYDSTDETEAGSIAEALITAGYGDVKEAEHRAEVAERALESACQDIISTIEFICEAGGVVTVENYSPEKATPQAYLKRAERELAEERKDGKLE